jgi:predicted MFS family arabinose efflux permease
MIPASYRSLFAIRATRRPLLGVFIGRLPIAAESIAAVLFIKAETGSFAIAGAVEACTALAAAVSLPLQGRLVDRRGQTGVLLFTAALHPPALALLVIAAKAGAAPAVLALVGVLGGASVPALSSCMRTLWSRVVADADLRQSAFALDAVLLELGFILGPLGVTLLVAVGSPAAALLAAAALCLIGTAIFASSQASREWRGEPAEHGALGPLASRALRFLLAVELLGGVAIGAMEISATAFAAQHGSRALAGALIAVQGAASMIGGLWYGSRVRKGHAAERVSRLQLLVALGFAPLALATSMPALFPLMALSGAAFAPSAAAIFMLIDELTPAGGATESSTWVTTALVVGVAMGNAVGGVVVGGHARAGFAVAAGAALLSWLFAHLARPAWLA